MARRTNRRPAKQPASSHKSEKAENMVEAGSQLADAPLALMKRFGEEMTRVIDDLGLGRGLKSLARGDLGEDLWAPPVEMFERDGELVVRADLPGLTKDDVNVEVGDGGITIEGERRDEKEEKREGFHSSERSYGKFYRRLPLPDGVNAQNANATFRNGVLEITMEAPKRTETKSKRRLSITDESQPLAKRRAA